MIASPTEIFAEAISVVPLVHSYAGHNQNALIIGSAALPAAGLATRYPFSDIVVLDASIDKFKDHKRVRKINNIRDLDRNWTADLIVIAEPVITPEHFKMARAVSGMNSVVVFAINDFKNGKEMRKSASDNWKHVIPYREHLPQAALFIMASDSPIKQQRKVPKGTIRIQESFIPSLFTLAKDEYLTLYGAA